MIRRSYGGRALIPAARAGEKIFPAKPRVGMATIARQCYDAKDGKKEIDFDAGRLVSKGEKGVFIIASLPFFAVLAGGISHHFQ